MDVIVALENVVTPDAQVKDVELYFAPDGQRAPCSRPPARADPGQGLHRRRQSLRHRHDRRHAGALRRPETDEALALGYGKASPDYRMLRLDPLRSTGGGREQASVACGCGSPVADVAVAATPPAVLEYEDGRDLGVLDLTRSGEVLDLRFAKRPSARALAGRRSPTARQPLAGRRRAVSRRGPSSRVSWRRGKCASIGTASAVGQAVATSGSTTASSSRCGHLLSRTTTCRGTPRWPSPRALHRPHDSAATRRAHRQRREAD